MPARRRVASIQSEPIDIKQLKLFVEVARLGSFAAAARQFDMAPSMVTRSVAALERELDVRLIQRSTRKLSLTDAGVAYHEHVLGVLEGSERASDEARATAGEVRGPVLITATVAYGQTILLPSLRTLHEQHPGLEIDLLLTDAVVDLTTERVDLAVRLGPALDSSLIGLQLAPVRYCVCASPAYLKTHGRPRVPADLAQCDCLRFPLPGFRSQWKFRDARGGVQAVDVRGWLVLSTALALHLAALDGLGPVLLAHWLVGPDLASGRLVDLFPEHDVTATSFDSAVWLLYASRSYVPRRVRAAMDFIKAQVGRQK